jgi:hypothetical protein
MTAPVCRHRKRGIALAAVIGSALVFSVAAYAVLYASLGFRQRVDFSKRNIRARYAAEAGMVWAMQRLWDNPAWTSSAGTIDLPFDVDQDGATGASEGVDVVYESCPTQPCRMEAKVRY